MRARRRRSGSRSRKGTSPACRIRRRCSRAGAGSDLMTMLRDGVIDAAIVDPVPAGTAIRPGCAGSGGDVPRLAARGMARDTLNHVIVVRESVAEDERGHARAVRALPRQPGDCRRLRSTATRRRLDSRRTAGNLEVAIAVAGGAGSAGAPAHGRRSRHRCRGVASVSRYAEGPSTMTGPAIRFRASAMSPTSATSSCSRRSPTRAWRSSRRSSGFTSPGARAIPSTSAAGATTNGTRSS